MDNIVSVRVFGYIKKAAKMLLIFTRNQISAFLISKAIEIVSDIIVKIITIS